MVSEAWSPTFCPLTLAIMLTQGYLNGSGIETLFGQLKHTTGGNLMGYSFETAKATL